MYWHDIGQHTGLYIVTAVSVHSFGLVSVTVTDHMASQREQSETHTPKRPIKDMDSDEEPAPVKLLKLNDGEAATIPGTPVDGSGKENKGNPAHGGNKTTPKGGRLTLAVLQNDIRELTKDLDNKLNDISTNKKKLMDNFKVDLSESLNNSISEIVKAEVNKLKRSIDQQIDSLNVRMRAVEENNEDVSARIMAVEETVDRAVKENDTETSRNLNFVVFWLATHTHRKCKE